MPDPNKIDANTGEPIITPPPEPPKQMVLDGDDIPASFKGKPAKEVIDNLLSQSVELEKMKTELETSRRVQVELEKRPAVQKIELSDQEKKEAQEKAFFADPVNFLENHFKTRTAPLAEQTLRTTAQLVKDQAKSKHKDWDKYEKDIDEIMNQAPLELRTDPSVYEFAYDSALGKAYKKILAEQDARAGMETEPGNGIPAKNSPKKEPLSDEEKRVASRFGITEDEYRDNRDNR